MKRLLFIPLLLATLAVSAQATWSYAKQGTVLWPAANAKDLVVGADDITYVFGDNGLIDIEEGAFTLAAIMPDGSVAWENSYDKPGTMEVAMRASQTADGNFLLSGIMVPGYRPYFVCTDNTGSELWNSDTWTDPMPENSASQTYAYALPSGNIACIVTDDVLKTVTRYEVDATTGSVLGTVTHSYLDLIPAGIGVVITALTADINKDVDDYCLVVADFTATGADTTDYIFRFNTAFEPWGAFGISNGAPGYFASNVIQSSTGEYIITGTKNTGAFFDLYSPMITVVDGDMWWSYTVNYAPTLAQATGGAIAQTPGGEFKWIRYQQNSATFDPAVGDYVEVATLDIWLTETGTHTINYAPYNTFECIAGRNDMPAIDDAYVVGGTAWQIGIPAYNLVIGAGAADAMPACIFNCVWPGDADNSGAADMDDLLAIGLGFGATGPARDAVDISWTAHAADEWATALPGGANHKYTDCNGDGVINADDELAVDINYGATHAVNTLRIDGGGIPLYFVPTGPFVLGDNYVPIYLGTDVDPVDSLYGIRFTAVAESDAVDTASVSVTFNDSWIGNAADMLQLSKNMYPDVAADACVVKTDQNNSGGYGEIGTLHFVVIDNIAGKKTAEEITLDFADVRAINVNNEEVSIMPETFNGDITLAAIDQVTASIFIFPNPVADNTLFVSEELMGATVECINMQGQSTVMHNVNGTKIQLPVLPSGQYLLRITTHAKSVVLPLSIQR